MTLSFGPRPWDAHVHLDLAQPWRPVEVWRAYGSGWQRGQKFRLDELPPEWQPTVRAALVAAFDPCI
jgi:hypothetical protein